MSGMQSGSACVPTEMQCASFSSRGATLLTPENKGPRSAFARECALNHRGVKPIPLGRQHIRQLFRRQARHPAITVPRLHADLLDTNCPISKSSLTSLRRRELTQSALFRQRCLRHKWLQAAEDYQADPGRLGRVHAPAEHAGRQGQCRLWCALLALRRLDQQWGSGEVARGGRLTFSAKPPFSSILLPANRAPH